MRSFGIILFTAATLFLFQCGKKENVKTVSDNASVNISNQSADSVSNDSFRSNQNVTVENVKEVFNYSGNQDGLNYRFTGRVQAKGNYEGTNYPNDNLIIEYSLKNTGTKNFVVYNQGHSDSNDRSIVYVEPQTDGAIELSQRLFTEPKDKRCPEREMPVTPRAGWLKTGESLNEKVFVRLPPELNNSFQACTPVSQMPANFKKVRFCIGVAEARAEKVSIDKDGIVQNRNVAEQKLLCSDEFALD